MKTVSLQEISLLLGTEILPDMPVRGFAADSRLVEPGFVFFALKGEKVDGHDYLKEVALKGALCAVVSRKDIPAIPGLYLIQVEDTLKALQWLATQKMKLENLRCVAVTGSVGKTTTKEFIATLLEGSFQVRKTPGNANSQVGLPLSILNLEEGGDVFVIEMGMSGFGEISGLLEIVPPEVVVMTKVALAHVLYFPGGIEDIAAAKAEILSHPKTKKAFINTQARQFKAFQETRNLDKVFYGLEGLASDVLLECKDDRFFLEGRELPLPFSAKHLAENFLAACLVARHFGMSWDVIIEQTAKLTTYHKRFEKLEKKGVTYINDSYNANPESVRAALFNLPIPKSGKKTIAVLGEMRELGDFSKLQHQEIGRIASEKADLLLCLAGDCCYMAEEFARSGKPAHFFQDIKDLRKKLNFHVEEGDVILLKASNSLRMWEVLDEVD